MNLLSLLRESKVEKTVNDVKNFSNTISGSGSIVNYDDSFDVPITINKKENDWELIDDPERLRKTYNFEDVKELLYFFNELYNYQFKINHHCKIVVDNLNITVETYTHGFDGVTDMDLKIKKLADELYNDVNYFKRINQ